MYIPQKQPCSCIWLCSVCLLSNKLYIPSILPVCIRYLRLLVCHDAAAGDWVRRLQRLVDKTSGFSVRVVENWWKTLTMKEFGDGAGLAVTAARPLTREAVPVATHAGELVIVKVRPRRAVRVTRHATQQRVRILHQSLLALGALVRLRAETGRTSLVTLCTN